MRVLLYEFFSSGGLHSWPYEAPSSLVAEGAAMLSALAADFARIPGVEPLVLVDSRFLKPRGGELALRGEPDDAGIESPFRPVLVPGDSLHAEPEFTPPLAGCELVPVGSEAEEKSLLGRLPGRCARAVLIAPEIDLLLLRKYNLLTSAARRKLLLCFGQLNLGNKQTNRERFHAAGVPSPRFARLAPGDAPPEDFPFPAVTKPWLGCGGWEVRRWNSREELLANPPAGEFLLEEYRPGMPASIAAILTRDEPLLLPVCRQEIEWCEKEPRYLGGEVFCDENLQARTERLARQALAAITGDFLREFLGWFPGAGAYVGIDLILGPAADGSEDAVLEINPRLTTSYIGLRHALRENLAELMLRAAAGESVSYSLRGEPVVFSAAGEITFVER